MKINLRLVKAHSDYDDSVFWEILFEDKQNYCCTELKDSNLLHNKLKTYPDQKDDTPFETPARLFFSGIARKEDDDSAFTEEMLLKQLILLPIYRHIKYCMFCGEKFGVEVKHFAELKVIYEKQDVRKFVQTPLRMIKEVEVNKK